MRKRQNASTCYCSATGRKAECFDMLLLSLVLLLSNRQKGGMLRHATTRPYATAQQPAERRKGGKGRKAECFDMLLLGLMLLLSNRQKGGKGGKGRKAECFDMLLLGLMLLLSNRQKGGKGGIGRMLRHATAQPCATAQQPAERRKRQKRQKRQKVPKRASQIPFKEFRLKRCFLPLKEVTRKFKLADAQA